MEISMRQLIYAASAAVVLLGISGQANALPISPVAPAAIAGDIVQAQFVFGGRNYCWYDSGWRGPGFYWCGYAFRRGLGWGGGAGWHGWHRGGGFHGGRAGFHGGGRPGGGHGGMRPGFGHGGGRPGG